MLQISERAQIKLKEIIDDENDETLRFRIFVQGGGCSGFQYGFTLDDNIQEDIDHLFMAGDVPCVVDSLSLHYLEEATVDFNDDNFNSAFFINNPNATTTCGCGSSFAV